MLCLCAYRICASEGMSWLVFGFALFLLIDFPSAIYEVSSSISSSSGISFCYFCALDCILFFCFVALTLTLQPEAGSLIAFLFSRLSCIASSITCASFNSCAIAPCSTSHDLKYSTLLSLPNAAILPCLSWLENLSSFLLLRLNFSQVHARLV